jgi:cobalt/nickel transport protein
MKLTTKLWISLIALVILSPLGLLLPEHFKAGTAWGEWGTEEMRMLIGYIPHGLEKLSQLWVAPLSDYAFKGWETKGITIQSFAYVFSGFTGVVVTVVLVWFIGKCIIGKGK